MIKRRISLKQPDGSFKDVEFRSLKKGDEFMAFEPDGEPCENGKVFKAETDATPAAPRSLDSTQLAPGEEDPWYIKVESEENWQEIR